MSSYSRHFDKQQQFFYPGGAQAAVADLMETQFGVALQEIADERESAGRKATATKIHNSMMKDAAEKAFIEKLKKGGIPTVAQIEQHLTPVGFSREIETVHQYARDKGVTFDRALAACKPREARKAQPKPAKPAAPVKRTDPPLLRDAEELETVHKFCRDEGLSFGDGLTAYLRERERNPRRFARPAKPAAMPATKPAADGGPGNQPQLEVIHAMMKRDGISYFQALAKFKDGQR